MLFAMFIIKDRRNRLNALLKNIKNDQEDLSSEKGRFNGLVYDIVLALNEFKYRTEDNRYDHLSETCLRFLNSVAQTETGEDMKDFIEVLLNNLDEINTDIGINSNYGKYEFINPRIIQNIMPRINVSRQFTIFDSACKDGYLLKEAKEYNKNAMLYGLEFNNSRAEEAKTFADRIIKGELKGSRISNDAFDIVYCIPEIKSLLDENMNYSAVIKVEKTAIANMLKYLRLNGIFMLAIPYYRMHKDICNMLAKQLTNVSIVKGIGNDENKGLIYIIGQKCKALDIDEEIYESLRKCYNYNNVKYIHELEIKNMTLPSTTSQIELFKGSVLDTDELLNIVQTSGCLDAFFTKQKVDKIHENTVRPLLPFNVGQIGLVLTSGCLDGIIDEGDGHYHLVKGRVSKKKNINRQASNGVIEETEIISNRVEINIILPDGDFKTLT
jgi:hypothetical protein